MNPPPLLDYPYPFEKPPALGRPSINQLPPIQERPTPPRPFVNGISTSESVVSMNNRPLNRPFQRPVNNQRPTGSYNPLIPDGGYYFESENNKDTLKPTNISITQSVNDKDIKTSELVTEEIITTQKPPKYQPPLDQHKKVADNTLVLGSDLQPIPIPTQLENNENPVVPLDNHKSSELINSSQEISIKSESIESTTIGQSGITRTTLKIETSSSIQVIEPTRTIIEVQPSIVPLENNSDNINSMFSISNETKTVIEPSKVSTNSAYNNNYHISTPTDGLLTEVTTTKIINIIKKTSQSSMSTTSFHKNSGRSFFLFANIVRNNIEIFLKCLLYFSYFESLSISS